ncbi:MAG: phage tail tube protein [Sphingomonadaceae bacterium]
MTQAIGSHGTLLKIGDGGEPEQFTTIAEVTNIQGPGLSMDTVDATSHDSPSYHEEIIAGIKRSGEVTFSINFVPTHATHNPSTGLLRDWANRTKRNFKLVFPDVGNTTWTFAAFVTGFQPTAPAGSEKLTADVTLKVASAPTLA